jgi:hypothetical protein
VARRVSLPSQQSLLSEVGNDLLGRRIDDLLRLDVLDDPDYGLWLLNSWISGKGKTVELSQILKDALSHRVVMDSQIATHAYNGIETLLFQPLRQMMDKTRIGVTREVAIEALNPFVKVIRDLAGISQLVDLIVSSGDDGCGEGVV